MGQQHGKADQQAAKETTAAVPPPPAPQASTRRHSGSGRAPGIGGGGSKALRHGHGDGRRGVDHRIPPDVKGKQTRITVFFHTLPAQL